MKYKTDFKKYWKSEVDKYKSISAGFLFFDDKEDAKKIVINVVKVKGCLIQDYFKLLPVRKLIQVRDAIPWVRCASGPVFLSRIGAT